MSRMIFWIVLFGAAWWFWRRAKAAILRQLMEAQAQARAGGATMPGGGAGMGRQSAPAPALTEPMVRCACCGAYSPRGETLSLYRLQFCNADHAQRYADGERPAA